MIKCFKILFIGLLIVSQINGQIIRANNFYKPLSSGSSSPLLDGLVGYWKLDESSGNATDYSGNSNTGTPTGVTQGASGKINTAYTFAGGGSSYLDCGTNASLRMTAAGTLSAWVYQTTSNNYATVIGNDDFDTDRHGYNFFIRLNGTISLELASASASQSVNGSTISNNSWHHIAATWDGTNVHIYIDGVDGGANSQTVTPTANTASFKIGNASIGSYDYVGTVDEVGVWNRALTGAEITSLYNSGSGKAYPFN